MPPTKKYKLLSAPSNAGEKSLCAFISTPEGCRNGDKCKFRHTTDDAPNVVEVSENASVVSSESEGQVKRPEKQKKPTMGKDQGKDESGKGVQEGKKKPQMKKKKPVSGSGGDDPFANPKKRLMSEPNRDENAQKRHRQQSPKSVAKATIQEEKSVSTLDFRKQQSPKSVAKATNQKAKTISTRVSSTSTPDFRNFVSKLPIASFSIPGIESPVVKEARTPPPSKPKLPSSPEKDDSLLLPCSTEVGRKWQKALLASRAHERYAGAFDFSKYKEIDKKAGINSEWIKAKAFGAWCASNPQAIAIDCEMCETQDPLSGAKNAKALCRVSVVDAENPEDVLLDTLVKPAWPVTDYRSRINGISKVHLENVEFTLRHAQAFMMALCSDETIIVGHAVQNDLVALNMEHHCNADSSFLFHAKDSPSSSVSLKDLVMSISQKVMPETHDSVNDARKALECVVHWVDKDGDVEAIERTLRHKNNELFVHRIPKQCKPEHLSNMFQKHTSIEPSSVVNIEFSGETGKTHVAFKTTRHANLAFDTLDGLAEQDKSGRLQKKVYLRSGDYVRVRKMMYANRVGGTPNKTPTKS